MNKILGKPIRSKYTYQKGRILGVNDTHIIVTFVEEEVPMPLKFEVFLENCLCEEEVKIKVEELKRKRDERVNTIRPIGSNQEDN